MPAVFSDLEKSQAKAVAIYYGSSDRAAEVLQEAWSRERTPTGRTIRGWLQDPTIKPDDEYARTFEAEVRRQVHGMVARLLEPLSVRLHKDIPKGNARDVKDLAQAFASMADRVMPRGEVMVNVDHSSHFTVHNINPFWTIGPAEPPGKVIQTEFHEPEALQAARLPALVAPEISLDDA